ncbi:MAG: hypothetical protein JRF59_08950 [Deltaproteobacteria bacterium]|nr:hypothetical protein [Deltaproteobacteria bacterium]MBW1923876.1 hypothetical protein [Deltaproteobacteria bacterium]MBW2007346.1 hypothetical protein [Deltaproteobacteria bacterium]MBW2101833.1 hypothetical protein [Deltaproteobacteria bacterium]MBW2347957.1 hypothetical protein [Deltaproteobacteria bacterium]
MVDKKTYENNRLCIEIQADDDAICLKWRGRSIDREPGKFIAPILLDSLREGGEGNKRVILDFRELDYMNSSTITPIVKILERAKRGTVPLMLVYDRSQKWQDLSFSALEIFSTEDHRVEIKGM